MIAERFPGLAQLSGEDKMTLMIELWKDRMGDTLDDNPASTDFVEQRWQEYQKHPQRVSLWDDVRSRVAASGINATAR